MQQAATTKIILGKAGRNATLAADEIPAAAAAEFGKPHMTFRPHYRPDIDGLRAVAILGVLIFHINPQWLAGGFVGVDVFFVISGYLITGILNRELERGTFSMVAFYERRIRRIFPALVVMLAVVGVAGAVLLLPDDFVLLGRAMRHALFGLSNLFFRGEMDGYFAVDDEEMLLLHTWSLSVEEQYYVIFPLLMAFAWRWLRNRRKLLLTMAGLGLLSLAGSELVVRGDAAGAFFLLPWRAWELLLGGCLALVALPEPGRRAAEICGWGGLALIAGSMGFFHGGMPFPGLLALVPCVGAALVIHGGANRSAAFARVLGWRPFVGLGLISYSVYLWHWPLAAFTAYFSIARNGPVAGVAIFAGSLILGWASWRFVEQPFRDVSLLSRRKVFIGWGSALGVMLALALVIGKFKGFPQRFDEAVLRMAEQKKLPERYQANQKSVGVEGKPKRYGNPEGEAVMAVWGDSHAGSLLPVLDEVSKEMGVGLLSYVRNGYLPLVGKLGEGEADEYARSVAIMRRLKEDKAVRTVVLAARWGNVLRMKPGGEDGEKAGAARLNDTIQELVDSGKQVILVYPVPEISFNVAEQCAKLMSWNKPLPRLAPEAESTRVWNPKAAAVLDRWKDHPGFFKIYPESVLSQNGKVWIRDGGTAIYRDDDHLSLGGSLLLKDLFREAMTQATARAQAAK